MSEAQFDFLLQKVSPSIQKADTFLRIALPAKLKLKVTLHYLATGTCFRTLSALYRVPACSISLMIPEVCKEIYGVLDEFIKISIFLCDDAFPLRTNILKPYSGATALNETQLVFNYQLSRGRRFVKNSFGILVARFRIYEKLIPLSVATTEQIVKTTCALHNWLRKTSSNCVPYVEQQLMDLEDWNQGKVVPGKWGSLKNDGLIDVSTPLSSNNHTKKAAAVRDFCANKFVTTDIVPWQWNMI
ncbi:hypothetical protein NQ314_014575 [Rhamnusium bicolor]|uniref:DDE Tnp4 domain-containing protein n=1 Tax=Rhamnusium bicolor TaxID=1586634 RepID=A0AAV8X1A9_9CUCU|nr:hypothetical protein NQ314_014575 [Rhamnusium bicolor]